MNLDPLVLPDGIVATKDLILCARGLAYAESITEEQKQFFTALYWI